MSLTRLMTALSLGLLTACAHSPVDNINVEEQSDCPLQLHVGQPLTVSLPSNPTTGYRWAIQDSAGGVLRSLGGQSTWRFQAIAAGNGRLRLTYQQPWEPEAEPAQTFDCAITVN